MFNFKNKKQNLQIEGELKDTNKPNTGQIDANVTEQTYHSLMCTYLNKLSSFIKFYTRRRAQTPFVKNCYIQELSRNDYLT